MPPWDQDLQGTQLGPIAVENEASREHHYGYQTASIADSHGTIHTAYVIVPLQRPRLVMRLRFRLGAFRSVTATLDSPLKVAPEPKLNLRSLPRTVNVMDPADAIR